MWNLVNEPVLLLNKHFLAIQVAIAKESICALVTGKARVVDHNYITYDLENWKIYTKANKDDPDRVKDFAGILHSPSTELFVPQVIIAPDCEFNSPMIKTIKYSRRNVYQRDKHTCQYCLQKFTRNNLTLDHVIPKCQGGKSSWTNVVASCGKCNTRKGDKLLSELGWALKSIPQQPKWKSHVGIPFSKIKKEYWDRFLG